MAYHMDAEIDDDTTEEIGLGSVDTTVTQDIEMRVQWDNAKADNTISIYQGYLEFKN